MSSTSAVEPGTRLAERFRLEDRVSESDGATLWKAIDEILARPVAVHTFSPDFPRVHEVVTAARAASRLTDPRLTQVFDAAEEDKRSYVVSEWVTGESLTDLLANGPLEPERAAGLVAEAAEALAHAHRAQLYHLCLRPSHLMWTSGNTVKVLGVAVDAAMWGLTTDQPALDDAEGLGRLLYAGLTGLWPGDEEEGGLPAAPMTDGHFCTPRQAIAGVPGYLDAVTVRACLPESRRGQGALSSPAEVADALADVARPMPIPISYPSTPAVASASHTEGLDLAHRQHAAPGPPLPPLPPPHRPSSGGGRTFNRVLMTLVVLLIIAAVGVGAWTIGRSLGSPTASQSTSASPTSSASATAAAAVVKPVKASGFDPLGDGDEKSDIAKLAIDGKPGTLWKTETYTSADLGRLKDGVGLLLDMGKSVQISDVVATLSDAPGATVELKVGDSPELGSLKTVATKKNAAGKTTLAPAEATSGQYVLIWFTRVPTDAGTFHGTIYEVVVHSPGSA
ncbi:serine/threonine protein kinase [Nonomuraea sp. MG754425]|uniref:protein kinase family protein n=1 Tax=Nonomuraea sp. MG754425 TaxID=2570319 RepID=UPI001F16852B|nr:protein kinase family protein [Nonomuraea sp. MG754425]MCF6468207.1 serine/threonine protein kinase [Nonomuraea sp. MG754425]